MLALALVLPAAPSIAAPAHHAAAKPDQAEAKRLTTFLDAEYQASLLSSPQQATLMGSKVGEDKLNDYSEAEELKRLEWRRGSVARMKARFHRERLPLEARISWDIWQQELDAAELAYKFRRYDYAVSGLHSSLPNFLISSHLVEAPSDMAAYSARVGAIGAALDQGLARAKDSAAHGIRMPRFQYERVIAESRKLIAGQPFDAAGPDSPLWADAKAKVGRLQAAGKVTPEETRKLLDGTRAAMLGGMKPGYERLIAWLQSDLANAPSGKVGAVTLPNGLAWYAAAL
jgi:uncharacterized protein (DUF885 family)